MYMAYWDSLLDFDGGMHLLLIFGCHRGFVRYFVQASDSQYLIGVFV